MDRSGPWAEDEALFGAVKWRANDVSFQGRVDPNYLIPMAAFRPREYSLGSADNALLGAQLSHRTTSGAANLSRPMDKCFSMNCWCPSSWKGTEVGQQMGRACRNVFGESNRKIWMVGGRCRRSTVDLHPQHPPLSYTHGHQPLGHSAGANFVEGRARIRTVVRDVYTVRISYLRRVQGRSSGGGESLLSFAAGEMPWTSFSEREGEDGHALLQGARPTCPASNSMCPCRWESATA